MAEATRRQVIHYYRRILGLAELFPDPVGALAIRVRCREQFRRHVAETDPLRIARHIADARKAARRVSHAVAADRTAVMRVMNLAFGRIGPLKHLFFREADAEPPPPVLQKKRHPRAANAGRHSDAPDQLRLMPPLPPDWLTWLECRANDPTLSRVWRRHYRLFLYRVPVDAPDDSATKQPTPSEGLGMPKVSLLTRALGTVQPADLDGYTSPALVTTAGNTATSRAAKRRRIRNFFKTDGEASVPNTDPST